MSEPHSHKEAAALRPWEAILPFLRAMRWLRVGHYLLLALLGAALLQGPALLQPTLAGTLQALCVAGALLASAMLAVVVNDLADLEGDRLSNPTRPLVRGVLRPGPYLAFGLAGQATGLALAWLAGPIALAGVAWISFGYFLYSAPPLRLKRLPLVGKLMIGLNSAVAVAMGFLMAGGSLEQIPQAALWWAFLGLGLAANFIDLKDQAGDQAMGVRSLPVLLGLGRARLLIAAFSLLSYAWGAWLTGVAWTWLPSLCLAALHLYLLYRKPYSERWVFLAYLGGIALLVGFFVLFAQ